MGRAVLATALVVLVLSGCSGGGDPGEAGPTPVVTTGSPSAEPTTSTTTAPPTTSEPPPAASPGLPQGLVAETSCQALDPQLQAAVDGSFLEAGSRLDRAQMIAGPDGTIYAGGDVLGPDGSLVSSADVWVFPVAGYALFSLSDGARELSEWPDGRDALGLSADDETGTALVGCIEAAS